jgi:hypothetical protein
MLTGKHMCSDFYLCGTQRREGTAALATRTGTTSAQPQDSAAPPRVAVVGGKGGDSDPGGVTRPDVAWQLRRDRGG